MKNQERNNTTSRDVSGAFLRCCRHARFCCAGESHGKAISAIILMRSLLLGSAINHQDDGVLPVAEQGRKGVKRTARVVVKRQVTIGGGREGGLPR